MSTLVKVQEVFKSFENVHAVNGVSLEIEEGQFYSLLGPSGCAGQTTLLEHTQVSNYLLKEVSALMAFLWMVLNQTVGRQIWSFKTMLFFQI